MSDFAKSILGFGAQRKEPSPASDAESLSTVNSHDWKEGKRNGVAGGAPSIKLLPKRLASAPTTAVSDQSMAYGTTAKNIGAGSNTGENTHAAGTFLSDLQPYYSNSSQYAVPAQITGAPEAVPGQAPSAVHHHVDAYYSETQRDQVMADAPNAGASSSQSSGSSTQPVIITTDEKGRTTETSQSSQPKGKLKVSILGARDLLVGEFSQPYVVSTYESSEYVNNATPSSARSSLSRQMGVPVGRGDAAGAFQRQTSQVTSGGRTFASGGGVTTTTTTTTTTNNSGATGATGGNHATSGGSANPVWHHEAVFDVVGSKSELEISVYDAARDDAFLGQVRISPSTDSSTSNVHMDAQWLPLMARVVGERVTGALHVKWKFTFNDTKKAYGPDDFDVLRLLGKGTFGQVYQVRKRDSGRIYAMKILSKKLIVKKKEIAHTIGERNILVRTSAAASPFIVGLKFSFQTVADLYLVTDYMSGGELFWHLQKEGRFGEDRAKFYIAELVLALEHLHDNDIVYRDLKPENILLDANGHIVLCDFGLSKANLHNDGTTNTFCGTTEYLAPEVLLDESGYTKMVDFWSLGVLIFEMCCGWSPFYADNTQQMYKNIAFGKVRFPKEVLSPEGRAFVKGLLNRNPKHRLGAVSDARELKEHPFFQDVDWALLRAKKIPPPFKPHLASETDTSNFDPEFTSESTSVLKKNIDMGSTPLSPGVQANFQGFTYVDASAMDEHFGRSVRYNAFKGPSSFIPGNPNLPPDDEVIDEHDEDAEVDEMDIDNENHLGSEEFVNGRFDL